MLYSATGSPIISNTATGAPLVELLNLEKRNDMWWVTAAVNGQRLSQPFMVPAGNVEHLDEDSLMAYLKDDAVSFAEYEAQQGRIRF